jgi:glycosyltransferase involved in cell wall biosynthesis
MRILLVSHPPLTAELGAAQIALHLAASLRARGHDAAAWSPEPLPPGVRWWNLWKRQRDAVERYASQNGPFDAIDTPAISASAALARCGPLVVRSVQPELLYLREDVRADLAHRFPPSPRALAHAALAVPRARAIVAGWRRARLILCLGSLELEWMRRRYPDQGARLASYVCAPSAEDRAMLAEVRRARVRRPESEGVRFLWIGRWAAHKGTRTLARWIEARAKSSPPDSFTIAGCGPWAERDLGPDWLRAHRVRLIPSFPRTELPGLLAAHDAGVFTSKVEGWGLSLNEMLESGLPVFATEAGAVADLRPFFPDSLKPFPPPERFALPPPEDLTGYLARFHWDTVARGYEEALWAAGLR